MEKPGKIKVTKAQAEQLVEHLQQYVRAALSKKNTPNARVPPRDCKFCDVAEASCKDCVLSKSRQGVYCTDPEGGYISSDWRRVLGNPQTWATPKQILARAQVLQERTNKWIYPWQIEDLSRVVRKEERK